MVLESKLFDSVAMKGDTVDSRGFETVFQCLDRRDGVAEHYTLAVVLEFEFHQKVQTRLVLLERGQVEELMSDVVKIVVGVFFDQFLQTHLVFAKKLDEESIERPSVCGTDEDQLLFRMTGSDLFGYMVERVVVTTV